MSRIEKAVKIFDQGYNCSKSQLDSAQAGLLVKDAVRAATDAALPTVVASGGPGVGDIGQAQVWIFGTAAVAGEVLDSAKQALSVMGFDKFNCMTGYDLRVGGETTTEFANDRVIGINV